MFHDLSMLLNLSVEWIVGWIDGLKQAMAEDCASPVVAMIETSLQFGLGKPWIEELGDKRPRVADVIGP
ncbi:hypothetical protein WICPIJ_009465 [Wickerhamomyces pijperi]|uniref:Uncharacterized protein n=1 Tax=Wickerhamomyces pijperi TaxID=599730 RepID=A0A9P8PMG9_WICPI|nr:hypothetical protein WICPIJ_009465 [Wickerhamomyces pijperi]